MVKPRQLEPQGPPLSAKEQFVKFDPVDSTIRGNNHKKPLDNYIIDEKCEDVNKKPLCLNVIHRLGWIGFAERLH